MGSRTLAPPSRRADDPGTQPSTGEPAPEQPLLTGNIPAGPPRLGEAGTPAPASDAGAFASASHIGQHPDQSTRSTGWTSASRPGVRHDCGAATNTGEPIVTTTEIPIHRDDEADLIADVVAGQSTAETTVDEEVLWVDSRELIIGDNVRTDVTLDKGFVADIKDRGVRQIIPVRRDEAGRLVVQTGQKRVLAATRPVWTGFGSSLRPSSCPTSGTGASTGSSISSARTSTAAGSLTPTRPAPPNSCWAWA